VADKLPLMETVSTLITPYHLLIASEISDRHFLALSFNGDLFLGFDFLASRFSKTGRPRNKTDKTDPVYNNNNNNNKNNNNNNNMLCYSHAIFSTLKYLLLC
jgi:hypothetical protein